MQTMVIINALSEIRSVASQSVLGIHRRESVFIVVEFFAVPWPTNKLQLYAKVYL